MLFYARKMIQQFFGMETKRLRLGLFWFYLLTKEKVSRIQFDFLTHRDGVVRQLSHIMKFYHHSLIFHDYVSLNISRRTYLKSPNS